MRVVHAAALTGLALLLASVASAQGIGDKAAQEKAKRSTAPAKPAKVYTESDIGPSMTAESSTPDLPATADEKAAAPADGKPAGETDAAKAENEARAKAEAAWHKQLDQARKEEAVYKDVIDKLQLELNDTTGGFYNPNRAAKIAFQGENKQKLAEVQGRISALEAEGRRNNYR
jgi:hypothetical protein